MKILKRLLILVLFLATLGAGCTYPEYYGGYYGYYPVAPYYPLPYPYGWRWHGPYPYGWHGAWRWNYSPGYPGPIHHGGGGYHGGGGGGRK